MLPEPGPMVGQGEPSPAGGELRVVLAPQLASAFPATQEGRAELGHHMVQRRDEIAVEPGVVEARTEALRVPRAAKVHAYDVPCRC